MQCKNKFSWFVFSLLKIRGSWKSHNSFRIQWSFRCRFVISFSIIDVPVATTVVSSDVAQGVDWVASLVGWDSSPSWSDRGETDADASSPSAGPRSVRTSSVARKKNGILLFCWCKSELILEYFIQAVLNTSCYFKFFSLFNDFHPSYLLENGVGLGTRCSSDLSSLSPRKQSLFDLSIHYFSDTETSKICYACVRIDWNQ